MASIGPDGGNIDLDVGEVPRFQNALVENGMAAVLAVFEIENFDRAIIG